MNAYHSARLDDYMQRLSKGEQLQGRELRDFNSLYAEARQEWENEPRPQLYGGDYLDVF